MLRTATFYDIKITAAGVSKIKGFETDFEADPKSMLELATLMQQLQDGGDQILKKGRSPKSARYYLSDMSIKDNRLILLVNRSDPTAPDSVSTDPDNKSRLVHTKPPGHGGDYSAHVVIELEPVKGDNYYLCVIETIYGSGLHVSSVTDYLRFVINHCRKQFPEEFLIPHNSKAVDDKGQPVMVRLMHTVELQGHPSEEFEKDLQGGTLSEVELLNFSKEGAVWDEKGAIVERKRSVQLRPQPDKMGDIATAIRGLRNKVAKDGSEYDHIRLRFKNEAGEPKDATIATDTGKLVNSDKYVKRHYIDGSLVNTTSLDSISLSIIKEVFKIME